MKPIIFFLFFFMINYDITFAQSDSVIKNRLFLVPDFGISISSMPNATGYYLKEEFISFHIGTNICSFPFEKQKIYFKSGINSIRRGGYHYFIGYGNYRIITNYIDIPINVGFYSNKRNQLIGGFMEVGLLYSLPTSHSVESPLNLTFPVDMVLNAVKSNYNLSLNGRIGIMLQDKKYKLLISYSNYKNIKNRYYTFNNRTISFSFMIPVL